eukprot:m.66173 g.66173  ORF g.66173 m.66173 type:complete len:416 (-) comp49859_c0_seq4:256-1503(-)
MAVHAELEELDLDTILDNIASPHNQFNLLDDESGSEIMDSIIAGLRDDVGSLSSSLSRADANPFSPLADSPSAPKKSTPPAAPTPRRTPRTVSSRKRSSSEASEHSPPRPTGIIRDNIAANYFPNTQPQPILDSETEVVRLPAYVPARDSALSKRLPGRVRANSAGSAVNLSELGRSHSVGSATSTPGPEFVRKPVKSSEATPTHPSPARAQARRRSVGEQSSAGGHSPRAKPPPLNLQLHSGPLNDVLSNFEELGLQSPLRFQSPVQIGGRSHASSRPDLLFPPLIEEAAQAPTASGAMVTDVAPATTVGWPSATRSLRGANHSRQIRSHGNTDERDFEAYLSSSAPTELSSPLLMRAKRIKSTDLAHDHNVGLADYNPFAVQALDSDHDSDRHHQFIASDLFDDVDPSDNLSM